MALLSDILNPNSSRIAVVLIRYLDIQDILRLASLNVHAHSCIAMIHSDIWNIDRTLRRWFDAPKLFRQVLDLSRGVVSGSAVLQFFDRSYFPGSDLDIFVTDERRHYFDTFLLSQDYRITLNISLQIPHHNRHDNDQDPEYNFESRSNTTPSMINLTNFISVRNGRQSKVQIIAVQGNLISHILDFHSSEFLSQRRTLFILMCLYSMCHELHDRVASYLDLPPFDVYIPSLFLCSIT